MSKVFAVSANNSMTIKYTELHRSFKYFHERHDNGTGRLRFSIGREALSILEIVTKRVSARA